LKLTWFTSRIGNRAAITICLLAVAALLVTLTMLGLRRNDAGRVDARLDDLARGVAASVGDASSEASLVDVIEALARQGGIESITVFDRESGIVVASTSTPSGGSISGVADPALRIVLEAALDGQPAPGAASTRVVEVPAQSSAASPRLEVLIAFDRSAVGSDLAAARREAMVALVLLALALPALGYLLVGQLLTNRLDRLGQRARYAIGGELPVHARDEFATLEAALDDLLDMAGGRANSSIALASRLPDMWIQLDAGLNVVGSRAQVDRSRAPLELGIHQLDELLSESVVQHVSRLIGELAPGETEVFGFTVGHREYRAELACHDVDTFELAISEDEALLGDGRSLEVARSADALDRLLGELPFILIELDGRGVAQWANAAYLGVDPEEIAGRKLADIVPAENKQAAREAVRAALVGEGPSRFEVELEVDGERRRWSHTLVDYGEGPSERLLLAAIELPTGQVLAADSGATRQLEEQLWSAELRISELEEQIAQLGARVAAAQDVARRAEQSLEEARDQIVEPVRAVVHASLGLSGAEFSNGSGRAVEALKTAVEQLATAIDGEFGTSLFETIETGIEPVEARFHLATFLDEIAIDKSKALPLRDARIDVRVQPSLPRWLHGNVLATRAAIHQMIDIARMVASDRPLVLAARQDTSTGRSVQVRFEVQIPPPQLDEEALEVARGCLEGDSLVIGDALPEWQQAALPDFNPLDIELVTLEDHYTVLRCSNAFDVADEPDTDHSWVRGLRTLIVQGPSAEDNGIQSSLGAFGIIGYVVSNEQALVEALRVAEEYSNPYRFVLADVDTPNLESFIGKLFNGDAPVVLVGQPSESAMVAALSAGYAGYLAKPVRQLDLLEVILSTVEPPAQQRPSASPIAAN